MNRFIGLPPGEAPTNFLPGREGRIVLRPAFDTPEARQTAEADIAALLKRQARDPR